MSVLDRLEQLEAQLVAPVVHMGDAQRLLAANRAVINAAPALFAVAKMLVETRNFNWGDGCKVPNDAHPHDASWFVRQSHELRDKVDEALAQLEEATNG